jgi:UDP-2,4-diacetamido-2,4,6-trideoxy-beta-L-altropyranose hydrolase
VIKKVIILTEGGRDIGFGHITRCLSLYSVFSQKADTKMVIFGDESVEKFISKSIKFSLEDWHSNSKAILEKINPNIIVVDSILVQDDFFYQLSQLDSCNVFIDDYKRRNILERGVIIDWTVGVESSNLHKKRDINSLVHLLGSKFTPLRGEFNIKTQKNISREIENILITFGGSDVRDMSPKVLSILSREFPDATKRIIIGAGFKNIDNIKKSIDQNTELILNADAKKMSEVMQNSDLAITGGGQTLYELARVGVPTVAVILAKNQIEDISGWEKVGFLFNIGWFDSKEVWSNLENALLKLNSKEVRESMISSVKEHIAPNGTENLVSTILSNCKNRRVK